jgi:hypothetical protein
MMKNLKIDIKPWIVYFTVIVLSAYVHEVGHCIPAWVNGYGAVPTPAKEYIGPISPDLQLYVSLGGVLGSIIFSVLGILWYQFKPHIYSSVFLAGAILTPGVYSLRFLLAGRGHDATEFQEAQAALGFSYNGHSLDWIFLLLFLVGALSWIIRNKPNYKTFGRLLIGFVLSFIFMGAFQKLNNFIFDPFFLPQ